MTTKALALGTLLSVSPLTATTLTAQQALYRPVANERVATTPLADALDTMRTATVRPSLASLSRSYVTARELLANTTQAYRTEIPVSTGKLHLGPIHLENDQVVIGNGGDASARLVTERGWEYFGATPLARGVTAGVGVELIRKAFVKSPEHEHTYVHGSANTYPALHVRLEVAYREVARVFERGRAYR
jgi:hypothetical protein